MDAMLTGNVPDLEDTAEHRHGRADDIPVSCRQCYFD